MKIKSRKDYAVEFARQGGKARAEALTEKQRQEIARKGGLAKAKARQANAKARSEMAKKSKGSKKR